LKPEIILGFPLTAPNFFRMSEAPPLAPPALEDDPSADSQVALVAENAPDTSLRRAEEESLAPPGRDPSKYDHIPPPEQFDLTEGLTSRDANAATKGKLVNFIQLWSETLVNWFVTHVSPRALFSHRIL
jgi:hypothetical protein